MRLTGDVWRLGHRPALDGLRGMAVLLVLAAHTHLIWWTEASGAAGVSAFFALSGFLITSLLLEERERAGRIALGRFYLRRAARLTPAMVACVALAVVVDLALFGRITDGSLVSGTLTYTSNFVMLDGTFPTPTGLGHTWSLAIEEQFYLLWPLALLAVRRVPVRWVMLLVVYGIVASVGVRLVVGGWHAYFGPDARAAELLIGCLLTFVLHGRATPRAWPGVGAAGLLLVLACSTQTLGFSFNVLLMPTLVAVGTALVILHSVTGPGLRVLTWRPLRHVGTISYGLYLYHAPVLLALQHVGLPSWTALLPTWLVAEASARWLEQPIRNHARLLGTATRRRRSDQVAAGSAQTAGE